MRIAMIGGLSRSSGELTEAALRAGHKLVLCSGDIHGRGAEHIDAAVERADLVIIVTDVNSHGGVRTAKAACKRSGRTPLVLKRCGTARFERLLAALAIRYGAPPGAALAEAA